MQVQGSFESCSKKIKIWDGEKFLQGQRKWGKHTFIDQRYHKVTHHHQYLCVLMIISVQIYSRKPDPICMQLLFRFCDSNTSLQWSRIELTFLMPCVHEKSHILHHFLPNVPTCSPWKYQKNFGFLMFSGRSKEKIGKKRVKQTCHICHPRILQNTSSLLLFIVSSSQILKSYNRRFTKNNL